MLRISLKIRKERKGYALPSSTALARSTKVKLRFTSYRNIVLLNKVNYTPAKNVQKRAFGWNWLFPWWSGTYRSIQKDYTPFVNLVPFFNSSWENPPYWAYSITTTAWNTSVKKKILTHGETFKLKATLPTEITCTKCSTKQGDQNPEHRTFKYDDIRKHVFEHGREHIRALGRENRSFVKIRDTFHTFSTAVPLQMVT